MELKGKVVMVSGATRGIGRGIALELAKQGANISFSYVSSSKEAATLESELAALGVKAKAFQVDIKNFDTVKNWVEETKALFGGLDLVVNNAGIIKDKALAMMDIKEWHDVINTNLDGTFNLCRAAIITFLKQKSGNIINITSVSGMVGLPRQTNYSASKAGIIGLTKALAKEVAAYGIRVNAVAPGFIETDMLKDLSDDFKAKILEHVPLARMGKVEEVAKAVKFLATDESKYITGQTIVVDGGMSIA
ncbi:MAG: 3-oxoacyl-[acyl-carrier-protein] reductase [Candidatus Omnitrophica bacterium]|nr:3-oxoacyl-[acyl-carrier-protein] reductase [Candidatus Omnitrophota bacterium]